MSLLVAGRAPPVSDRATFVDYHRKSMRLVKTCQAMLNNQCLLVQDIHVQFTSKMNMYTIYTINTIYTNADAHCDCTILYSPVHLKPPHETVGHVSELPLLLGNPNEIPMKSYSNSSECLQICIRFYGSSPNSWLICLPIFVYKMVHPVMFLGLISPH